MRSGKNIAVVGATGHTGRFVVRELCRRGWAPILVGRDADRLEAMARQHAGADPRVAAIDDGDAMARALEGARAVVHCAGPFLDTATPVALAALRAGIHYLDVTAEQGAARDVFERFARAAADARVAVVPAAAFYGGLADLLATAAMGEWPDADAISVAVALDRWWPTPGTRRTGERNTARRWVVEDGQLAFVGDPSPGRSWSFPAPFGTLDVAAVPLSEVITMSRHLHVRRIRSYMNLAPLADLRDASTPAPVAADESGRSLQSFAMDVVVRRGAEEARATARGRDIYAVTAPLVVEAAERILDGRAARVGAAALGELFDATDFLASLARDLEVEVRAPAAVGGRDEFRTTSGR
jgi:Saccharopine dehydrogenase NADP binding domain